MEPIDRMAARLALVIVGGTFYNWFKHRDLIFGPDRKIRQKPPEFITKPP